MRTPALLVVVAFLTGPVNSALAQSTGSTAQDQQATAIRQELDRLKTEFQALRQQYDERFATLEARLATLEGAKTGQAPAAAAATPPAQGAVPVPAGEPGAQAQGSLPVYGNTSALSKVFNPDIAVIGDFIGTGGRNVIDPGPAFDLHEAEVSYQAVVDPYARADFFFSYSNGSVDVEEGYLSFTSLPGGLLARVGKMRGAFGKVDQMHTHVLPWVDRPLVIRNLAGGEDGIDDAGVSLQKVIPVPGLFLEATGQVFRGTSSIFQASRRSDLTYLGHLRAYRDITESSNIDLGTSVAVGNNSSATSTKTHLYGFDATFRYRPLRRAVYRQFIGRTELVWNRSNQQLICTDFCINQPPVTWAQARAFGFYVSGDYEFRQRWFAGARYDYSDRPVIGGFTDKGTALLLTYWPSEFSQVRGEWRRTRYAEGRTANELLFQFLFSIGAHGAHAF